MKRLIIFATVAVLTMSACAQSSNAKKYIKKYDVINIVKELPKGNAEKFWDAVHNQNKRVRELGKAIEEGNKTALKTAEDIIKLCAIIQQYDVTVDGFTDLTERIAKDLGIEDNHRKCPIKIINDNTYNASMDAMGQMRINVGSIRLQGININFSIFIWSFQKKYLSLYCQKSKCGRESQDSVLQFLCH